VNHLQITNMLEGLSLADLRQLETAISAKMASMLPARGYRTLAFKAGMKCIVDHKKVRGMIGEIIKVNRTRCRVEFEGTRFNVPMSMIQSA